MQLTACSELAQVVLPASLAQGSLLHRGAPPYLVSYNVEDFDAAVARCGGETAPIVVQLHIVHCVPVPGIKTRYSLRHARG